MSTFDSQIVRVIEWYLTRATYSLTPVPDNLQPPGTSPSGEVIFPLCIYTNGFNSHSPHWQAGMGFLTSLTPLIQHYDWYMGMIIPDDYREDCQRYNQALLNLPTSAGRNVGVLNNDACFHTMKLSINVSQAETTLSCGHESRYVATTIVGDYIVGLDQGPRRAGPVERFVAFVTRRPVLGERFEGTKYRLEFFLPPVRERTKTECPAAATETDKSDGGAGSGGQKEGGA